MPAERYLDFVQEAIRYIELHLYEELDAKAVAQEVGFSPYHFHRIFSGSTGMSVCEYIRISRLNEAARRLLERKESLMEIALKSGFDTQESFTRAFKKQFAVSPGKYRKDSISNSKRQSEEPYIGLKNSGEFIKMEVKIVEIEEKYAVGMGAEFKPKSVPEINLLWQKFIARSGEIDTNDAGIAYGICSSSHPGVKKIDPDSIVYIAALPVSSLDSVQVPDGMTACKLSAGRYAVFTHKGQLRNLPETIDLIWGSWVPESGINLRDAPDFELYDRRFDANLPQGEIDIYVPII